SDPEQRGAALFAKPFPNDPSLSCARCDIPSAAFVDHLQHDVGSGGFFKTPTLLNANFNAPYFHDGRFATYERVVEHFDRLFALGLSSQDQTDLVAYLTVVGDGLHPYERDGVIPRQTEIMDFASVLNTAIPAHDTVVITLVTETVGGELRELTEKFPAPKDTNVSGGREQRRVARAAHSKTSSCVCGASNSPQPPAALTQRPTNTWVSASRSQRCRCCCKMPSRGRSSTRRSMTLITLLCGRCTRWLTALCADTKPHWHRGCCHRPSARAGPVRRHRG